MYSNVKEGETMSNKGFNKKLPKHCEYCIHGLKFGAENEIMCKKKGITNIFDSCRHYKYDPLKREPLKAKVSDNYNPEDFSI